MKKITLAVFLVLFTISCAPVLTKSLEETMEEYRNVYRQGGPAALAAYHGSIVNYDSNIDLLLGLYYYPLIGTPSQDRYFYHQYNYLPPPASLSPVYKSLWIQSEIESELRDYEYKLKSIHDMEMFQMKLDVQGLIDDLKREMEKVKKD